MNRIYELEMAKGKFPIADPGLEFWSEIISQQFDETEESLEDRSSTHGLVILKEEREPDIKRVEPFTFKQKDYFLETQYNVYGVPKYTIYDKNYNSLYESHDINEVLKFSE